MLGTSFCFEVCTWHWFQRIEASNHASVSWWRQYHPAWL